MEKIILPIKNSPGYYVSNYGEIYSKWEGKGPASKIGAVMKRLKPAYADGRWHIQLGSKGKTLRIHRIVLETFVGKRPDKMEACHFPDRNTGNNRLDNLRWDTRKGNERDKIFHGTSNSGENNGSAKLKEKQIKTIRGEKIKGDTYKVIANKYHVSLSAIQQICEKTTWKHVEE
ncbi:MAG TPA: hypothetical protein ENH82_00560 [bacterium]|nr:hypothetical protein [bacterium]